MGLSWGIAYLRGIAYYPNLFEQKKFQLFFFFLFVISWIGAKVFYLILSAKDQAGILLQNHSFWFGGGFVFYGGLVFGLLYCFLLTKLNPFWNWKKFKNIIPGLILGHAIGRVGCFFAGCCYGVETENFFSFYMHEAHRVPIQLYEAIGLMGLYFTYLRWPKVETYLFGYSLLRFILEFYRGDSIRGTYFSLSSSQWVSVFLIVYVVFTNINNKHKQQTY